MTIVASPKTTVDETKKFVRVTGVLHDKFTEFEFSVGDPNLYVELVLPFDQFQDFCRSHDARQLTASEEVEVDLEKLKWRFGKPGQTE